MKKILNNIVWFVLLVIFVKIFRIKRLLWVRPITREGRLYYLACLRDFMVGHTYFLTEGFHREYVEVCWDLNLWCHYESKSRAKKVIERFKKEEKL